MELVVVLSLIILYFLPSIFGLNKKRSAGIMILNLFLGWTVIGWVIALIWSVSDSVDDENTVSKVNSTIIKICPYCSEAITPTTKKCPYCAETITPITKMCPYCAETILKNAIICRFCKMDLKTDKSSSAEISTDSPPVKNNPPEKKNSPLKLLLLAIPLVLVGLFIIFVCSLRRVPSQEYNSGQSIASEKYKKPTSGYELYSQQSKKLLHETEKSFNH